MCIDNSDFSILIRAWNEYPLTADKFISWIAETPPEQQIINLFMNYEVLGSYHPAESGIFDFFKALPRFAAPAAAEPVAAAPAVETKPAIVLPGAPEGLTEQEASVIARLRDAVAAGQCSLDRAKASLSEGGLSFKQLTPKAVTYARVLILKEPSTAALDVGF
jgi:hypothetical protein